MLQSHQFKNKMDCSLLIIYQDLSGAKPSKQDNLSVHSANRLLKISRENILLGSLGSLEKCVTMKKGRNCFSCPDKRCSDSAEHPSFSPLWFSKISKVEARAHHLFLLCWTGHEQQKTEPSAKDFLVIQHPFSSHTSTRRVTSQPVCLSCLEWLGRADYGLRGRARTALISRAALCSDGFTLVRLPFQSNIFKKQFLSPFVSSVNILKGSVLPRQSPTSLKWWELKHLWKAKP